MGVLLMLMTIGGLLLAAALVTKRYWLARFATAGVGVWAIIYVTLLLGSSLTSAERDLGVNEPKEFCGLYLDCHLHSEVTGVRVAKTIGSQTAKGEFYIVDLKVFSDAKNPRVALHLTEPSAVI